MKHSSWKLLFHLLTSREQLVSLSERHLASMNTTEAIEEKHRKLAESQSARSVTEIRHTLCVSLWMVLGSVVAGCIVGRIYVSLDLPKPLLVAEISQYLGVAILLWATLGKIGWSIQTMNGNTLPEQVNDFVYRLLYIFGSICLAVSASAAFGATSPLGSP